MEIAVGILSLTVLYGAGLLLALLRRKDLSLGRVIEPEPMSCSDACKLWDTRRQQRCNAEAAARAARELGDALFKLYLALLATAAALLASALALLVIPFVGPAIASALFAASAAVGAAAVVVLGQYTAAVTNANQLAARANEERQREGHARDLVLKNCPPDEAKICLATPSPC